jgi:glycosyltransferase involved in cell wall biosynthesis
LLVIILVGKQFIPGLMTNSKGDIMISVGLVMICKNEEHIILRCLESCKNHVDAITIVDTGSTDNTKTLVRSFIKKNNLKGNVVSKKWIDFATNRTQAIKLAKKKSDYLLILDADMELMVDDPDWKSKLDKDYYLIKHQMPGLSQYLPFLIKSNLHDDIQWQYISKTHEYLDTLPQGASISKDTFYDIHVIEHIDGQSRSHKFARDIELLEEQLKENIDNHLESRTWFYLAQSYENQGLDYKKALRCYQKRVNMGGWTEEVAYSYRRMAYCYTKLNYPWQYTLELLLFSYSLTPQRAEALIDICTHYRLVKKWHMCYYYASLANTLVKPEQALFIEDDVYNWRIKDELAIAAYWLGQYQQSYDLNTELLNNILVPLEQKERIKANLEFSKPYIRGTS